MILLLTTGKDMSTSFSIMHNVLSTSIFVALRITGNINKDS